MIYEEAAELTQATGYKCKTCGAFYAGEGENSRHMARWCHASDLPCKCGKRNDNKSYTVCATCRKGLDEKRWNDLPVADWNGEDALSIWHDDKFFYWPQDVADYLEELNDDLEDDDEPVNLEDLRIVLCKRVEPRRFDYADFFDDYLSDAAQSDDYSEIDEKVNDLLSRNFPETWQSVNVRASIESLRRYIGDYEHESEAA